MVEAVVFVGLLSCAKSLDDVDGCGDASDDNNDVTDQDEDSEIPEICGHSFATHNTPTSTATTVSYS